jgi:hypothetical protein
VADQAKKDRKGPFIPRTESQKILSPEELGTKIQNMVVTEEGTLRSVCGPTPYVPNYGFGYPTYGTAHGIHHAVMAQSGRDLLLLHVDDQLWVHQGWNIDATTPNATWDVLLGPSTASPLRSDPLPNPNSASFPTQFESTPAGVVIVPQGGRSYFYDGIAILPLGYDHAPNAPTGAGPSGGFGCALESINAKSGNTSIGYAGAAIRWTDMSSNQLGYAHDGSMTWSGGSSDSRGMHPNFGFCEIGTLLVSPGVYAASQTATLLTGSWQCKAQWIDRWGNLSPLSTVSNPVILEQERGDYQSPWEALTGVNAHDAAVQDNAYYGFRSGRLKKQVLWHSIEPGPEGTIGRVLVRTKDQVNSGTLDYFEITPDKTGSFSGFSTIPDNVSTVFPDNVADAHLLGKAVDAIPVPLFKVCKVWAGRLWIGNIEDRPGVVIPSMPGRWGTFEKDAEYEPDPTGSEVTALWRAFGGLFVFTANSTFLISPSNTVASGQRQGFKVETVNSQVGCAGPSTVQTMQDGSVVWLSNKGFHRATMTRKEGLQIVPISESIERTVRNLNKARLRGATSVLDKASGEYRCWVPDQNSTINNLCLVFDGSGWRRRTDVQARASCSTIDHREYSLVAGIADEALPTGESGRQISLTGGLQSGVWVLDHEVASFVPNSRDYTVETSWLAGLRSLDRKTAFTVYIWLRETSNTNLNVEVYRDWRMKTVHTETVNVYSTEDAPPFWNTATLSTENTYKLRRPFWVKADLFLPACESFKLKLTSQSPFEFVGISVAESDPDKSGMRIPK